jgi:hypothetical protein
MEREHGQEEGPDQGQGKAAGLTRGQMAMALRIGSDAAVDRDGPAPQDPDGAYEPPPAGFGRAGAGITVAMLVAGTLAIQAVTGNPAVRTNSGDGPPSAGAGRGSIPRAGGGTGAIQDNDSRQEQQKMFGRLIGVAAATAVGVSTTIAGAQATAVQWRVEDGGNGHWYESKIFGPTMTGESARLYASQRGSYLVSITSPAESDFVRSISAAPEFWGNSFLGPMIGMYRDEADCSAGCWDSGEPVSYTNWHPGNPDPSLERCVYLYIFGTAVWQDYSCELPGWGSNAVSAILEWSADCNNDGIVDYGQILNGEFADINHNGVPDRICECIGDLYADGFVNGADLGALLAYWGPVTGTPASQAADIDRDGVVNGSDLGILLAGWGACAP